MSTARLVAPWVLAIALASGSAPSKTSPCPDGMARIDEAFCIDRYEASLELVDAGGRATPWSPYLPPTPEGTYRARSARLDVPQSTISQRDALRACAASGKRLCTDREWTRACRGVAATRYPYGQVLRSGYCNDQAREPLAHVRDTEGRTLFDTGKLDDPRLNRVPGTLARAGLFSRCHTEEDVFDMVGNLHEWTADPDGTMRGGFYLDARTLGEGCDYRAVGHDTAYRDYSTGFRCCADPT